MIYIVTNHILKLIKYSSLDNAIDITIENLRSTFGSEGYLFLLKKQNFIAPVNKKCITIFVTDFIHLLTGVYFWIENLLITISDK